VAPQDEQSLQNDENIVSFVVLLEGQCHELSVMFNNPNPEY